MKESCQKTDLRCEILKFYCNQGLVPHVKRDEQNRRVFSGRDIRWIQSLNCLKNCNMGIWEMQEYLALCLQGGEGTIPERKRAELEEERKRIQDCIDYIAWKQRFYDEVLSGQRPYISNLIGED